MWSTLRHAAAGLPAHVLQRRRRHLDADVGNLGTLAREVPASARTNTSNEPGKPRAPQARRTRTTSIRQEPSPDVPAYVATHWEPGSMIHGRRRARAMGAGRPARESIGLRRGGEATRRFRLDDGPRPGATIPRCPAPAS